MYIVNKPNITIEQLNEIKNEYYTQKLLYNHKNDFKKSSPNDKIIKNTSKFEIQMEYMLDLLETFDMDLEGKYFYYNDKLKSIKKEKQIITYKNNVNLLSDYVKQNLKNQTNLPFDVKENIDIKRIIDLLKNKRGKLMNLINELKGNRTKNVLFSVLYNKKRTEQDILNDIDNFNVTKYIFYCNKLMDILNKKIIPQNIISYQELKEYKTKQFWYPDLVYLAKKQKEARIASIKKLVQQKQKEHQQKNSKLNKVNNNKISFLPPIKIAKAVLNTSTTNDTAKTNSENHTKNNIVIVEKNVKNKKQNISNIKLSQINKRILANMSKTNGFQKIKLGNNQCKKKNNNLKIKYKISSHTANSWFKKPKEQINRGIYNRQIFNCGNLAQNSTKYRW